MNDAPQFSLVVATLGRTQEVERLLASLARQTFTDFELIVVDQNRDDRLVDLLARQPGRVLHLRQDATGASRARNAGLAHARGRFITFPDDDCWYPHDLLAGVAQWFDAHPQLQGLTIQMQDGEGRPSHLPWRLRAAALNTRNVWTHAIMIGIFLRREVVDAVGEFDPQLGVGAGTPWGSGEETDYLLRALARGLALRHDPSLVVCHPDPAATYDARAMARGRSYGAGMGRVLALHRAPAWFKAWVLARALAGIALGLAQGAPAKARFHWNVLCGRLAGLRARDGRP